MAPAAAGSLGRLTRRRPAGQPPRQPTRRRPQPAGDRGCPWQVLGMPIMHPITPYVLPLIIFVLRERLGGESNLAGS